MQKFGWTSELTNRLYFHHIPKTAGTSLNDWLVGQPRFARAPMHLWSEMLRVPKVELNRYNFFSGHFYRPLHRYLGEDLDVIIFLRNPIDRSISHFEHILRSPGHYFFEHVDRHRSFLEFVLDPVTRPMVENFQLRAISTQFDPATMSNEVVGQKGNPFALEQQVECLPLQGEPDSALMIGKDYLSRALVVGLTESFAESMRCISDAMSLSAPAQTPRKNVAPSSSLSAARLSAVELEAVIDATRLDWELYQFAITIFTRQISGVNLKAGILPQTKFERNSTE